MHLANVVSTDPVYPKSNTSSIQSIQGIPILSFVDVFEGGGLPSLLASERVVPRRQGRQQRCT